MAFRELYNEIIGTVPGMNVALARTKINEALGLIYDDHLWSFQCAESGWLTPGLLGGRGWVSAGTISVQPFSTTVTGDATASAIWATKLLTRPLLTEQQLRVPAGSLYNIVAVDVSNPEAAVLTLDRSWMDAGQVASGYMIYQAYFPAPAGFKKFHSVRDTTNNAALEYGRYSQRDLAEIDPQRLAFDLPRFVVPYQADMRPGSATQGQMLYELWPHPLSSLPYAFQYLGSGPRLVNGSDMVPYPLNEDLVKWRALEVCFLWAEAQKGVDMERGSGADWRFLSQEAHAQYESRLQVVKRLDQNMGDLYFSRFRRNGGGGDGYATYTGQINVGW